ncbi:hypothetical protein Riv7116_6916 (plasmid) [Rivularia sp. PCC 7116]|uniref:hypothetical protein n=1 Tax=Rivularia sp. PCC 7116 TaxID=373994 RepID=UPI00029F280D|nr:hypothetical protein [Rivularia sp. PCC 7116]AFY59228.1 hypothetical protein Riv7116_6916 [Rivularia sp. PCC 7116]
MNYTIGKYFYSLYLACLEEAHAAYDQENFRHWYRASARATRMCELADLFGYDELASQIELWKEEGLI